MQWTPAYARKSNQTTCMIVFSISWTDVRLHMCPSPNHLLETRITCNDFSHFSAIFSLPLSCNLSNFIEYIWWIRMIRFILNLNGCIISQLLLINWPCEYVCASSCWTRKKQQKTNKNRFSAFGIKIFLQLAYCL